MLVGRRWKLVQRLWRSRLPNSPRVGGRRRLRNQDLALRGDSLGLDIERGVEVPEWDS